MNSLKYVADKFIGIIISLVLYPSISTRFLFSHPFYEAWKKNSTCDCI